MGTSSPHPTMPAPVNITTAGAHPPMPHSKPVVVGGKPPIAPLQKTSPGSTGPPVTFVATPAPAPTQQSSQPVWILTIKISNLLPTVVPLETICFIGLFRAVELLKFECVGQPYKTNGLEWNNPDDKS